MDTSMEQFFLGPMPVTQFLDEFLPETRSRIPKFSTDLFAKAIADGLPENKMYKPYMDVITENGFIPGFKMVNTSFHIDDDMINSSRRKSDSSIELQAHDTDDAFVDPIQGQDRSDFMFESRTMAGMASQSQLNHYATKWFARQHRRHAFTIFVFGNYVRFIRWDRAEAIVSEKFNFDNDCSFFVEFLWRFSHLDPFVRRATPQEAEIAHKELEEWPHEKKYLLKDGWRAYTLAPEADILRDLRKEKVEHVPTYIFGGDVIGGVTRPIFMLLSRRRTKVGRLQLKAKS
ncbi:hypothetical protein C0992_001970 [Termitomyces sp. T32_za158]|nr:hypothetical protein C0992_001970 [Termitomyces sp. T32_za158]